MVQILQKNNLEDFIPEAAKKKSEDQAPKKGNPDALVVVHFSPNTWIVYSDTSHHIKNTKDILSSITACTRPPILMGDDSLVEVTIKGRVELDHGSFENVLHVPQLFLNLLSMYHITHIGLGKKVEIIPNSMSIFDMQDNSKIVVREVNHKPWLYTFYSLLNLIPLYYLHMLMTVVGYGMSCLVT